jgi:DNA-binding response OmpR family regulator
MSQKILVAVDGEATQDIMKEILAEAGYEVFLAGTGKEALSILDREHPHAAFLDVALPQVLGFEICEIIKKSSHLKSTGVVLVSSIYDKARYKREPQSLYGADDYIERHHIHDQMVVKLRKILGEVSPEIAPSGGAVNATSAPAAEVLSAPVSLPPPQEPVEFSLEPVAQPVLQPETTAETAAAPVPLSPPQKEPGIPPEEAVRHEEAKRFARLIVSDIALYNQKTIEEGIENGNVEELLKEDMAEAEKLYQGRVSKEIREKTNYLRDALQDFVDRKKQMIKNNCNP